MAETSDNVYVENEDFVPDPTDLRGTFQTTRTGVTHNYEATAEVFAQDRFEAAKRAKAALDGEGGELYFTENDRTREAEEQRLRKVVEPVVEEGAPKPGAPTEAEQEAAQENDLNASGATSHDEQPDISDALHSNRNAQHIASTSVPKTGAAEKAAQDAQQEAAASDEGDAPEGDAQSEEFDPSAKSVDEVNEYLATADDAERERVLAAERSGKNRKTVDGI